MSMLELPPKQWTRTQAGRYYYPQIRNFSRIGPWLASVGLIRFSNYFPQDKDLPPEAAAAASKGWVDTTRFMQSTKLDFKVNWSQPHSFRPQVRWEHYRCSCSPSQIMMTRPR